MERDDWYVRKSKEVVDLLPRASRDLLSTFNTLPNEPVVAHATLIAFVCYRYADGVSPDSIADHLKRSFFPGPTVRRSDILEEIVLPGCSIFRTCALPFDNYWDAYGVFDELLDFYTHCRIRAPGGPAYLMSELSSHWMFSSDAVKSEIIQTASRNPSDIDLSLIEDPPDDSAGDTIRQILKSRRIQAFIEKNIAFYHPSLFKRPDLLRIVRFLVATDTIRRLSLDESILASLLPRIEQARRKVGEAVRGLSAAEVSLLVPADSDRVFMEQCVAQRRNVYHVAALGLNPLPDRIHGQVGFPIWIEDFVFSQGGRLHHASVGPIPHLFSAFDAWPSGLPKRIGLAKLERSGSDMVLPIIVVDPTGHTYCLPFRYNLKFLEHVYDLLLLAVVGRVRLDLAQIQEVGSLELLLTTSLEIPEGRIRELKEAVVPLLQERYGSDAELFRQHLIPQLLGEDAWSCFSMCENAKSERLFIELKDLETDRASEIGTALLGKYRDVKSELLAQRDQIAKLIQARRFDAIGPIQDNVRQLERELVRIREEIRWPRPGAPWIEARGEQPTDLCQVLESKERCFLHLTYRAEHMSAFWCRPQGDGKECGAIDLSFSNLKRLEDLTAQWLSTKDPFARQDTLTEIAAHLGRGLAEPIAEALVPRGVKHLVISPAGFLELLPLHCAPVSPSDRDGPLLCDVFERLTYAPSLRILERLRQLGRVKLDSYAAAAYSSEEEMLPNVEREVRMLTELFSDMVVLEDNDASPEKVLLEGLDKSLLHIAGHGSYILEDHYTSGFQLFGQPKHEGWLSVARVLAEGDFRSTGLVTLAACESGRSRSRPQTIQNYSGVDGSFVARGARSVVSTLWEVHDLASFLFMVVFYLELRKCERVDQAYSRAVGFLRFKRYDETQLPNDLEAVLQSTHPTWRSELEYWGRQYDFEFSHPWFWGTFKCSGLTWGAF